MSYDDLLNREIEANAPTEIPECDECDPDNLGAGCELPTDTCDTCGRPTGRLVNCLTADYCSRRCARAGGC